MFLSFCNLLFPSDSKDTACKIYFVKFLALELAKGDKITRWREIDGSLLDRLKMDFVSTCPRFSRVSCLSRDTYGFGVKVKIFHAREAS